MYKQGYESINKYKIGIVGCGHLGQAIANSLVKHGLARENLLISFGGSPLTYQKLETDGLTACLATNEDMFLEADIIMITLKPSDIFVLNNLTKRKDSIIVSCVAGVSIELLSEIFKTSVCRMMFSGPDTIVSEQGIATIYPKQECLQQLLSSINVQYIPSSNEEDLNVFTAGVCMPAALLKIKDIDKCSSDIQKIKEEYPLLFGLFTWAKDVLPEFKYVSEKDAYLKKMITKGGITEAIINSIDKGEPLNISLLNGIKRTKEISLEIQKTIIS